MVHFVISPGVAFSLPSTADLVTIGRPAALTKNGNPILRSAAICADLIFLPVRMATSCADKKMDMALFLENHPCE